MGRVVLTFEALERLEEVDERSSGKLVVVLGGYLHTHLYVPTAELSVPTHHTVPIHSPFTDHHLLHNPLSPSPSQHMYTTMYTVYSTCRFCLMLACSIALRHSIESSTDRDPK